MNVVCQTTQIWVIKDDSIYLLALLMLSPTSACLAENVFSLSFVNEM